MASGRVIEPRIMDFGEGVTITPHLEVSVLVTGAWGFSAPLEVNAALTLSLAFNIGPCPPIS